MLQFTCPKCQRQLKLRSELAGKRIKCPHCAAVLKVPTSSSPAQAKGPSEKTPPAAGKSPFAKPVSVPAEAAKAASAAAAPAAASAAKQPPPAAIDLTSIARQWNIDLSEEIYKSYKTPTDITNKIEELQKEFPKAESAYRPSYEMSSLSSGWLAFGAQVGTFAGMLAAAGGVIVAFIIAFFLSVAMQFGIGRLFNIAADDASPQSICAFISALMIAVFVAFAAGSCVSKYSRKGRNRNPMVAALFAAVAAVLALVATGLLARAIGFPPQGPLAEGVEAKFFNGARYATVVAIDPTPLTFFGTLFTLALGSGIAAAYAYSEAAAFKYCEDCELPMVQRCSQGLSPGGVRLVRQALQSLNLPVVLETLRTQHGEHGHVQSWRCPNCQRGLVELHFDFPAEAKYGSGEATGPYGWMIASIPVEPQTTQALNPVLKPADEATEKASTEQKSPWLPLGLITPATVAVLATLILLPGGSTNESATAAASAPPAGVPIEVDTAAAWSPWTDPQGRFQMAIPQGWNAYLQDVSDYSRSSVLLTDGTNELRIIARETQKHQLEESDRQEMEQRLRQALPNHSRPEHVLQVDLTEIEGRPTLEAYLHIIEPEKLRMTQFKWKEHGHDHTVGIYVKDFSRSNELAELFSEFMERYAALED